MLSALYGTYLVRLVLLLTIFLSLIFPGTKNYKFIPIQHFKLPTRKFFEALGEIGGGEGVGVLFKNL